MKSLVAQCYYHSSPLVRWNQKNIHTSIIKSPLFMSGWWRCVFFMYLMWCWSCGSSILFCIRSFLVSYFCACIMWEISFVHFNLYVVKCIGRNVRHRYHGCICKTKVNGCWIIMWRILTLSIIKTFPPLYLRYVVMFYNNLFTWIRHTQILCIVGRQLAPPHATNGFRVKPPVAPCSEGVLESSLCSKGARVWVFDDQPTRQLRDGRCGNPLEPYQLQVVVLKRVTLDREGSGGFKMVKSFKWRKYWSISNKWSVGSEWMIAREVDWTSH